MLLLLKGCLCVLRWRAMKAAVELLMRDLIACWVAVVKLISMGTNLGVYF